MLKKQTLNKATTKNRGRTLLFERTFKASRTALFKAYTDAELLKQWWGPHGWALDYCELNPEQDGTWHYCLKCIDESKDYFGTISWAKAVYKTIDAPSSIQYEEYFSDEAGELVSKMSTTLVTVRFVEDKNRTRLINEIDFPDKASLQKVLNMGLVISLNEGWEKLSKLLTK